MPQYRGFGPERPRREFEGGARKANRGRPPAYYGIATLFILFVAGGLYSGCVFLTSVTTMFSWIPVPRPSVPVIGEQSENIATWKGTERVNLLLLGVDQRPDERGQPTRSDTMIVITLDPATRSAGMLSIPRDLWVPIPGHGENKINTAHFFGEVDKKGGGPALAKRVVQDLVGLRIHYFAKVDFQGFEKLVDTVGGVMIDVDRPLKDDEYPTENYGIRRVYIPAGIQHMDGTTALQYARSRHADNDIGRNRRQQKVLLAARQQALQLNLLPKLPSLINTILQSVQTDLSPADLLSLAKLAREVDASNIVARSIDDTMFNDVRGDGTVLTLKRQEVAKAINDILFGYRVKQEAAKIEVQNGTSRAGLAASVAALLKESGYSVVRVGNASSDYKETVIIDYTGKKTTTDAIADLLKVLPKNTRTVSSTDRGDVDILVILGQDTKTDTKTGR